MGQIIPIPTTCTLLQTPMKTLATFLFVLFVSACTALADPSPVHLTPTSKSVRLLSGEVPLSKTSRIVATDPSLHPLAETLSEDIQLTNQLKLPTTDGEARPEDIVLKTNPQAGSHNAAGKATIATSATLPPKCDMHDTIDGSEPTAQPPLDEKPVQAIDRLRVQAAIFNPDGQAVGGSGQGNLHTSGQAKARPVLVNMLKKRIADAVPVEEVRVPEVGKPCPVGNTDNSQTFKAEKRYLVFPRTNGLKGENKVFVKLDGELFFAEYDAVLASSDPDFWTYIDLKLHQGKQVTVSVTGPNADGIALVKMSDTIPSKVPLYHEPGRPQVHFSPLRGWLNDSSGMFYLNGKWHYYYMNTRFGNLMAGVNNNWSHAVSTDLLHWQEEPMLHTVIRGKQCYWTGSAAVDVENATGLGKPGHPAVVFACNQALDVPNPFTQCFFVSTDEGMTAKIDPEMMFKALPKEDNRRGDGSRDDMIRWYAPEKKWILLIYNKAPTPDAKRSFFFFESKDLKTWTETSVLENMYECPNFVQMPLDGNASKPMWVVWGASTEYRVGNFDGKKFTPVHDDLLLAHHGDYYASQVFDNAPNGRIIQMGWGWVCNYNTEFTQMATFPMELSLKSTPQGPRLYADFISELSNLRDGGSSRKDTVIKPDAPMSLGDVTQPMEIDVEFEPGTAKRVSFTGAEMNVNWDAETQVVEVQGVKDFKMAADGTVPARRVIAAPQNGRVQLHVLLDIPSVEVTTNGGEHYIIKGRDFKKIGEKSPLQIAVEGGNVTFHRLDIYPLKSIQPPVPK